MNDRVKILVADDNFSGRQLLTRLLRQCTDAELIEARDGAEAVRLFGLARPQVCFLDIDMPELDGMAALKEMRGTDVDAFIVMVSAFSAADKVQEAVSLGIGGFVVKPYSARRIHDVLARYASATGRAPVLRDDD
jgi:two-component system chemotaxis response regulator CheY